MKNIKRQQEQANNHPEGIRSKATQEIEELEGVAQESLSQKLPEQKVVFKADSIKSRVGAGCCNEIIQWQKDAIRLMLVWSREMRGIGKGIGPFEGVKSSL